MQRAVVQLLRKRLASEAEAHERALAEVCCAGVQVAVIVIVVVAVIVGAGEVRASTFTRGAGAGAVQGGIGGEQEDVRCECAR